MKKTALRKLELHRETLAPLQQDQLDDVNGGTSGLISASVRVSIRACGPAISASARWLSRQVVSATVQESVAQSIQQTVGGDKK